MTIADDDTGGDPKAGVSEIGLRPVRGDRTAEWKARFDGHVLSLVGPDGQVALMLPRDEASRHIRFRWDVFRGRVVEFVVLQGLKAHAFRFSPHIRDCFFAWLPQKTLAERAQEARFHGAALVLFGMLQLYLADQLFPVWGAVLQAVGLVVLLRPLRGMHGLLGVTMLLAGLAMLFSPGVFLVAEGGDSFARVLATASGSVLLLWGIQQFSLLGPSYHLRPAETREPKRERERSRLVARVAMVSIAFALAYGIYAVGLFVVTQSTPALPTDSLIFLGLSLLSGLAGLVLLMRRQPPYLEARITAQLLIIVAVLYLSGIAAGYFSGMPFAFSQDILANGILRFDRPYVWAPLIVLLVLFQRWFLGRVEREAEEHLNG